MEYFEVVEKRQSIRKYQSRPIEPEKLEAILKAANQAPSAGNFQAYEIYRNHQAVGARCARANYMGHGVDRQGAAADYFLYPREALPVSGFGRVRDAGRKHRNHTSNACRNCAGTRRVLDRSIRSNARR